MACARCDFYVDRRRRGRDREADCRRHAVGPDRDARAEGGTDAGPDHLDHRAGADARLPLLRPDRLPHRHRRVLHVLSQRGGVRTFGYPSSRTFKLDGFQVQIFQRLVMQLQGNGSVQTLNLLDPGLVPYTRINGSTYPAPDPSVVRATPRTLARPARCRRWRRARQPRC